MHKQFSALLAAGFLLCGCQAGSFDTVQQSQPAYTVIIEDAPDTAPNKTEITSEQATASEDTAISESAATSEVPAESTYLTDAALTTPAETVTTSAVIEKDGTYTTKEDVALYIYTYGELPANFITKKQAQALGWTGGSLEPYAPGMCIGGDRFGNYEGLLPKKKGRTWTECDIDTLGKNSRGAKRIIFSNDGLIYYTGDHYESFELLYGEP